jgi:membrane protein
MGAARKSAGRGKGRLGSAGSARPGKSATAGRGRGRASWWDIARQAWAEFWDDQIPMIAAGMAFYSLLAIFPAIGLFVSLWGLFGNVGDAQAALAQLATVLPGGALTVVGDQMARVASGNPGGLTLAAAFGLLLSIWSANGAMSAILTGLNMAYGQKEERGFVRRTLVALAFTMGLIGFGLASVVVLVLPVALHPYLSGGQMLALRAAGFCGLFAVALIGLSLLYHFGPSRHRSHWRWLTWGGSIAGAAWLAASIAFSLYVGHFGSYNSTYGSLGAVIGFMTWIWISAMVILLGAEVNAEIEEEGQRGLLAD